MSKDSLACRKKSRVATCFFLRPLVSMAVAGNRELVTHLSQHSGTLAGAGRRRSCGPQLRASDATGR